MIVKSKKTKCICVCKYCGATLTHKRRTRLGTKNRPLFTHAKENGEYIDPDSFGGQSSYSR